jgi:Cys-tRNA synthase (O-phospho-L-seryl-tRNA:Cys-tRNA synthase)
VGRQGENVVSESGHEIKIEPETIQKLAEILAEEVCEPLDRAGEMIEGASTEFYNWGAQFTAMDYTHAEIKQITKQTIKSFAEKSIKEDIGEKLHITGKNWKEAEEKSKVKKA